MKLYKNIAVTLEGTKYTFGCEEDVSNEIFFAAYNTCKKLIGEFYFPLLVCIDNHFILLQDKMIKEGSYVRENKKTFNTIQRIVRKRLQYMQEYFVIPSFYEELSEYIYEDLKPYIKVIKEKASDIVYKENYELDVIVVSLLIELVFLIFDSIIRQIKVKTSIDFTKVFYHLRLTNIQGLLKTWCPLIDKYHATSKEDNGTLKLYQKILDIPTIKEWQEKALEAIDSKYKQNWVDSTVIPDNNTNIYILKKGKIFKAYFRDMTSVICEDNTTFVWQQDGNYLWVYEKEFKRG
jgi:hypothetical protein